MTTPANNTFTAAQIARPLGNTPQAVRKALLSAPAAGVRVINGAEAAAWSVASLPEPLRNRLAEQARLRGYRDSEAMLSDPPKQWTPALPLDQIA